jgi:hypothetical protein
MNAFTTLMETLMGNRSLNSVFFFGVYKCEIILFQLDLRNNKINSDGGLQIALMLSRNSSLKSLDLRWNSIGKDGSSAILSSLSSNHTLTECQLSGNDIPTEIARSIAECLHRNKTQRPRSPSPRRTEAFPSREHFDSVSSENSDLRRQLHDLRLNAESNADLETELRSLKVQYETAERDWRTKHSDTQNDLLHLQQTLNETQIRKQALEAELQLQQQNVTFLLSVLNFRKTVYLASGKKVNGF